MLSFWVWLRTRLHSCEILLTPTSRWASVLRLHRGELFFIICTQMRRIGFCHIAHIAHILINISSHPHLLQAERRNPFNKRESIIVVTACLLRLLSLSLIHGLLVLMANLWQMHLLLHHLLCLLLHLEFSYVLQLLLLRVCLLVVNLLPTGDKNYYCFCS